MLNKLTKIKRLLLIGKEIWHNKRSMRGRFIIDLLSLVLLAGSAMLILLNVIGIVQPPSHDIDRFLEYELNTRTNDIKRQMNALAAHNIDLSQQLQQCYLTAAENRAGIIVGNDRFTRVVGISDVIAHIKNGGGGADVAD